MTQTDSSYFPTAALAQLQPLKDGFGTALALVFMVGFKDQAFVRAVVRERNRQNRLPLALTAQTARPAMAGLRP